MSIQPRGVLDYRMTRLAGVRPPSYLPPDSKKRQGAQPMEPIKFVALDKDDLDVVSTHLQDAEVKVADVHWRPQEKRLVLAVDRFDWPAAISSVPQLRRCRAALRFD